MTKLFRAKAIEEAAHPTLGTIHDISESDQEAYQRLSTYSRVLITDALDLLANGSDQDLNEVYDRLASAKEQVAKMRNLVKS